jgi:hypothetical protein
VTIRPSIGPSTAPSSGEPRPGAFGAGNFVSLAIAAFVFLGVALERCRHGLDVTDEGMYLNYIANPGLYPPSITQFGFIYHPLYRALGGDVALLRQANIAVTFSLALWLMFALLSVITPFKRAGAAIRILAAVPLALPSLLLFMNWVATPSYNALALQGMLLSLTGIAYCLTVGVKAGRRNVALLSAALIGGGGWLVFMAKPSSAALLAPGCAIALLLVRRPLPTLLAAAGFSACALLASATLIDGSPFVFAERVIAGYRSTFELGGHKQPLFRWETQEFSRGEILALSGVALWFAIHLAAVSRWPKAGLLVAAAPVMLAAFTALCWSAAPTLLPAASGRNPALVQVIAMIAALTALHAGGCLRLRMFEREYWGRLALALLMFAAPFIFAFGTGSQLSNHAMAGIVPVAGGGVVFASWLRGDRQAWAALVFLGAVCLAVTPYLITGAMEAPYRLLAPLRLQTTAVRVGPGLEANLLVDPASARFISELKQLAPSGRMRQEQVWPVLDLTGSHPGALFAIGAKPIGLPWFIGGYEGSEAVARRAVARIDCAGLSRAWLLIAPGARRALHGSVIAPFDLTDFELAGRAVQDPLQNLKVLLLKPRGDAADRQAKCEEERKSEQRQLLGQQ